MAALQQILDSLVVPAAFARYDRIADPTVLAELCAWKANTESLLNQLDSFNVFTLSTPELANLVRVLAPLTAVVQWSSPATRSLATAHLAKIPASDHLIVHILTQVVKPLFAPTPHPRLHTSTARILPRPADVQDTYVEQPWKEYPRLDEVIRWCLLNTEPSAYENAWPLFLPPVMSLLDDYQVPYKLLGIRLVSNLLTRVPPQLLIRTGVDMLIFNSLVNSLSHLGDHSTPDLIRSAVTTTLQLVDLTTPSTSPCGVLLHGPQATPTLESTCTMSPSQFKSLSTRFSRLSVLLSSSLLGTAVMYTPTFLPPVSAPYPDLFVNPEHMDTDPVHDPGTPSQGQAPQKRSFNPTLIATAQSLPPVLSALGVGGVRFLKGVLPVLAGWLVLPLPIVTSGMGYNPADIGLHLASLSSLSILLHTCTPRIKGWLATIVDAIGRCWVGCLDIESQMRGDVLPMDSLSVLKKQLKKTAVQLSRVCPDVIKNEYAILLTSNKTLFDGLVGEICQK